MASSDGDGKTVRRVGEPEGESINRAEAASRSGGFFSHLVIDPLELGQERVFQWIAWLLGQRLMYLEEPASTTKGPRFSG
jgi:hypothetical protein